MTGKASAPASAANLGPGFDCLALALELRCAVRATRAERWQVEHVGPELPPAGAEDLVGSVGRAAAGENGPFRLIVENAIPVERGLGSSAAVRTATWAAVRRALGEEPPAGEVLEWVRRGEGHADNAAAAVHGGLVAVSVEGRPVGLELHPTVLPVVAVPERTLSTEEARRVLPDTVPHPVAARSLARAVFLVEGLRRGDRELLEAASGDELHEPHRDRLFPLAGRLVAAAREAGAALAAWSGAGSSVLALALSAAAREGVAGALEAELGDQGRVLTPEVAVRGLA